MNIILIDKPISDADRAESNFKGDLLIYQNIPAMHELIAYADTLLCDVLDGIEPAEAQHHYLPNEFLRRTTKAQSNFRQSQIPKDLFFKALEQCGVDLNSTYYDHFPMRIVPFDKDSINDWDGARCGVIGHHRDTWGSNIHCQLNWWAPLYELEKERTIAIYPDYWLKPIENYTSIWSFEVFLKQRGKATEERLESYPSAPSPQASVDESGVVRVMLKPGDILSFASAHLHASVPNTTQSTRFSVEMRSINKNDLVNNRAAPNVDNEAGTLRSQWFRHIISKEKLRAV
jgi:hypothetical protein